MVSEIEARLRELDTIGTRPHSLQGIVDEHKQLISALRTAVEGLEFYGDENKWADTLESNGHPTSLIREINTRVSEEALQKISEQLGGQSE